MNEVIGIRKPGFGVRDSGFAKSHRGLTLIELLIAASLLAIVFIPLSMTLNKFLRGWWQGMSKLTAQQAGRDASYFLAEEFLQSSRHSLGNILENGSFDQESSTSGIAIKWDPGWQNASSSATLVSTGVLSGFYCLQFGMNGLGSGTTYFRSDNFLIKGSSTATRYLLAYAYKSQFVTGTVSTLRFSLKNATGGPPFATNSPAIKNTDFTSTSVWKTGGVITSTIGVQDTTAYVEIEYHTDDAAAPTETMWVDNVGVIPLRAVLYDEDNSLINLFMSTTASTTRGYPYERPSVSAVPVDISTKSAAGGFKTAMLRTENALISGAGKSGILIREYADREPIGYNPISSNIRRLTISLDGPEDSSIIGLKTLGYNTARRVELEIFSTVNTGNRGQTFYVLHKFYPLAE